MDEFLYKRVRELTDIADRLDALAVELDRRHGLAPARLEYLRYDVRRALEAAQLEYAEF